MPETPPTTAPISGQTHQPIRGRARTLALVAILLASFIDLMYVTLLNVVLPSIEHDLAASPAQLQWMLSGYTLALAVGIISGARLGDLYGHKRVFVIGLLGFTAASALCALAGTADWLVLARVVQGLFAAAMLPQVLTQIQVMYEPGERGGPIAAFSSLSGIAATVGPVLGPALMTWDLGGLGWRLVFWLNVPVGIFCAFAALRYLPHSRVPGTPRLDLAGVALSAVGLFLVIYPLITASDAGASSAGTGGSLVVGVIVLALFVWHQRRRKQTGKSPVLEVSLFRFRSLSGGLTVQTLFFVPVMGFFLVFMLFLQGGLGLTPMQAGLTMLPWSVMVTVFAMLSAVVLLPRIGRVTVQLGLIVLGIAFALIAHGGTTSSDAVTWWPLLAGVGGAGMGMVVAPLAQLTLSDVPVEDAGSGSALFNTFTQLAASIGVAVIGLVFFTEIADAGPAGAAMARSLWLGIILLAVALAATFLLPRRPTPPQT
ncbi:MFS transporter [Promicromonospora panici]|uniref:MFS transporter n=1 Tax=Promicromonospora panici TaxID=2219658 RepID=UPI0013EC0AC0|nr:MFS transporter [Promicromonospora panici]